MGCGHDEVRDGILYQRLHPLNSLTASVLAAEVVRTHPLDIANVRHGNDDIFVRDQILGFHLIVHTKAGAPVVPVFVGDHQDLFADHAQQFFLIRKDLFVVCDLLLQVRVFRFDLAAFQSCQGAETHVHDRLGLNVGQSETRHKFLLRDGNCLASADNTDHLVDIVQGDQQSLQDMSPFFRFVQVIFCSSGNDIFLVLQVIVQHLLKVQHMGFVVYQSKHDDAESIFQLRVLEQAVQHHLGIGILPELDHDAHAFSVGLVPEVCDAVDALFLDKVSDLFDETRLIHQIRQFRHNDPVLAVLHRLDIGDGADADLPAAAAVRFRDTGFSEDHGAGGEIRSLHQFQKILQRSLLIRDLVIDDLHHCRDHFTEIVWRNIGRHTDSDSGGAVDQKIRETAGKHGGLFFCLIKVRHKFDGVLVDVGQHLHGDLRKPCLCITHRGSAVAVHGTEVAVSVHQRITKAPLLRHID